jgi:hypothetical protein
MAALCWQEERKLTSHLDVGGRLRMLQCQREAVTINSRVKLLGDNFSSLGTSHGEFGAFYLNITPFNQINQGLLPSSTNTVSGLQW